MLVSYFLLVLPAFTEHPIPPAYRVGKFVEINEILCEDPRYAMDFAAALSKGDPSELAKDEVGKQAHREVCGRFIGLAVLEKTAVATNDGVIYQLTAFRFKEDNRVGWFAASSFAPQPTDKQVPL